MLGLASCAASETDVGPTTGGSAGLGGTSGSAGADAAAGSGGQAGSGGSAGNGAAGGAGGVGGAAGSAGSGGSGTLEGGDGAGCDEPTPDSTCGTFPQCGCDIGQKCDVIDYGSGKAICTAAGNALPYTPCFQPALACIAGSACVGSVCKPYCDTLADCPGTNRQCIAVQYNDSGVLKQVPGMFTCTSGCDPIAPGAICGPTLTCAFVQPSGPATDCFVAGNKTGVGQCSANDASACAPGYLCVNNAGSYDCLKWCRMSNPNDCQTTEFCQGLQSAPTINGVQYGVCSS